MPKNLKIKKVLLLGSGPIVIGQAAEFDYSGSQACRALKDEGVKIVLANSNPATIQTDLETADEVYIEPLNSATLTNIIEKEKPDGIIATMAGQTGLNLAVELEKCLAKNNVAVLGTKIQTICLAEDREMFKELMQKIGEPVPASASCKSVTQMQEFIKTHGLPVMIRADYCLGGLASGIAKTPKEADEITARAIEQSGTSTALVEKSLGGMAELEYEIIRDSKDNCICICNMENLDPMGIHTGESIVVAPSQTLSDKEYQMLRSAAIRIVRALKVEGACNVQFALDQTNGKYYVVEVNPRASRSSALASKATGYPIARVAAKIALGYSLDEIENKVTGKTAMFEPSLDYVVVKIPRWPFDKLYYSNTIGTQMKSTGEAMAIGRSFEEALGKALRSLEMRVDWRQKTDEAIALGLEGSLAPTEIRLPVIMRYLEKGTCDCKTISKITGINEWFLEKIQNIGNIRKELSNCKLSGREDHKIVARAKAAGFSDKWICEETGRSSEYVRFFRESNGIVPQFKMVDTCSAEFEAVTPYFYSTYENCENASNENGNLKAVKDSEETKGKVIILGSGPIRIGQGIEFDYCTVHAVMALRKGGYEAIIINNNPETVSTDFDISDRLYFDPLRLEDTLAIIHEEKANGKLVGVIAQFGGQTAINLVAGITNFTETKILGTSPESIDVASNRKKFKALSDKLGVRTVDSGMVFDAQEALQVARMVGYPVLVRPSYVLGGRAMHIAFDEAELSRKVGESIQASEGNPVIIDHFLENAVEVDVDLVGDGKDYLIAGIMEQVEEVGIHSGDSAAVLPSQRLSAKAKEIISDYALKLASSLSICGLCNIQMAVKGEDVFVIEVNPRASRTVPFVSKAIGVPIAKVAALCQVGISLEKQGFKSFPKIQPGYCAVKIPVFPFQRFPSVDCAASSEMKSTGEVMAFGKDFPTAYIKGICAAGQLPKSKIAVIGDCGKWTKVISNKARDAGFEVLKFEGQNSKAPIEISKAGLVVDGLLGCKGSLALRQAAIASGKPVITSYYGAMAFFDSVKALGGFDNFGNNILQAIPLSEVAVKKK